MKTLPRFDETEITVEDGVITIKQIYNSRSIAIPVALWGTVMDAVNAEVFTDENQPIYPDTVTP